MLQFHSKLTENCFLVAFSWIASIFANFASVVDAFDADCMFPLRRNQKDKRFFKGY